MHQVRFRIAERKARRAMHDESGAHLVEWRGLALEEPEHVAELHVRAAVAGALLLAKAATPSRARLRQQPCVPLPLEFGGQLTKFHCLCLLVEVVCLDVAICIAGASAKALFGHPMDDANQSICGRTNERSCADCSPEAFSWGRT